MLRNSHRIELLAHLLTATLLACASLIACASGPPAVEGEETGAWGYLRLVPPDGVHVPSSSGGSYGDRRMADVTFVDYSRPGFAVVYTDGPPRAAEPVTLAIRDGRVGPSFAPHFAVQRVGGDVVVENATTEVHTISCPRSGLIARIDPGSRLSVPLNAAGEYEIYALDLPGVTSRVFIAPGDFSVVSPSGRYALTGLSAGHYELHAWHPRFPSATQAVELAPGVVRRLDFELGASGDAGQAHAGDWDE